jgi:H+/Cl- antiporter ClcA/predicted transcriptional regulator
MIPADRVRDRLGDFTADSRLLTVTLMAAIVGVIGAFVAVALVWLIGGITNLVYYQRAATTLVSPAANTLGPWAVLVPVVGGLAVGLMARYGSEKIRGHGIPEAMEAILVGRSRLSLKVAILKPLSSAIAIGTGGPFGAEGPIIMTGGAFGSLFAQAFHLSASERKTLLVAGAAAGMAAIFATPLAAVLLAVELLLFEWKPRSFIPVATAAAVAAVLRVPLLGAGPIFPVTSHGALSTESLGIALAVGILAGGGAALLTWLVYACEDAFAKLPVHWMWWPMLGGLVVGLGGLVEPRALGVGYDTIRDLFDGHIVGAVAVWLLVTKALVWSIALGSGTSGGVLAPLLIMGGAIGAIESSVIPGHDAGLWAMISMAAIMGGTMRSPLTGVAFLLELTHDIDLLPALLIACVAAHGVTVLVMRRSILTEKVARRGYHVLREYTVNPLARFRVADVMTTRVVSIPADMRIDGLFRRLLNDDPVLGRGHAWPLVAGDGSLVGIITRGDLVRALEADAGDREPTVLEAGRSTLIVAHPDDLLEEAVNKMVASGVHQLPVVRRDDPRRVVGFLDQEGVSAARRELRNEEHVREAGRLAARLRLLRRKMRHVRDRSSASMSPQ